MIPPLPAVRQKSISRWLTDNDPQAKKLPPVVLIRKVKELDEVMLEAFESREDVLKEQMMRNKTWGTAAGLTQFQMDRLTLWQEVVSEFLTTTSDLQTED